MAYTAYQQYQAKHGKAPVIDGLTGDQRFFLAYAQAGRRSCAKARAQRLLTDPHRPAITASTASSGTSTPGTRRSTSSRATSCICRPNSACISGKPLIQVTWNWGVREQSRAPPSAGRIATGASGGATRARRAMKALVISSASPPTFAGCALADVARTGAARGEVLIHVTRRGAQLPRPDADPRRAPAQAAVPFTPGMELAGEVELGGRHRLALGDAVVAGSRLGGFADLLAIHAGPVTASPRP